MQRRDAIFKIMESIDDELVVCNIGFPSRELYNIHDRAENFYMIGSMGLASSIGLGLALSQPDKDVVVIDGDGALLMNMGSLVTVNACKPRNLTWIVINNGAYGSTGNQETYAKDLDLVSIANSVGFKSYNFFDIELKRKIRNNSCNLIVFNCKPGNSEAPIIDLTPEEIKNRFMKAIEK
ncbi:sulfopyruvate decarboxylase subunit beta [Methanobrevibacter sp.]|uniref:sulfopyruvate decarboxylase subunit beta n=1 Tax=Methanobrevibacter sp. TaxID=66852 RepID=UPI0038904510